MRPNPANRRTVRVARWSATHPWRAVALWLVFVAAAIAVGSVVSVAAPHDSDYDLGQSGTAQRWINDAGLAGPDTETVLITARSGNLDPTTAHAALDEVRDRMRDATAVGRVDAPLWSPDRQAAAVQLTLSPNGADHVDTLLNTTASVQAEYPQLRVEQVGSTSLDNAVNDQVATDLSSAAIISLPVTLVILVVVFGAIVAAGVPILLALSAVGAATGLSALVSHVLPDSGTTSSMILLMGMAVGVDYSLFYVKRARAERHAGRDSLDAIELAAQTSGHSVLVSGMAVIVSMLGLFLADDVTFSSLAAGSILVVAIAVLGSLTVLPALLMLLGRRIDRPRVPLLWRWTMQVREPRLWPAILRPSLHHPVRTLVIAVLALGTVALPALGLSLASGSAASLPDSIAEKQALDRLLSAFPDQHATTRIVVNAPASYATVVADRLVALRTDLADDPGYTGRGRLQASANGTVHVLSIDTPFDPESPQARAGVEALRSGVVARAIGQVPGARWAVGGDTAASLDSDTHAADRLPWVIGFVVLLTMLMIGVVFRSVVLAVVTAAANLLSAGAAFGVLALVFQHHWAEGLLGFRSTGKVINWIPLFTFAVLFGLSMDYHVFVLGHIREAAERAATTRDAIRDGIVRSAGTVTSAAVVMVSVFSIFAALHMIEMKELGVGLAVAVLVDALVVRGVVLPATLTLLGRRMWWPGTPPLTASTAGAATGVEPAASPGPLASV